MSIRNLDSDRDEMIQAINDASPDAAIVLAVMSPEGGFIGANDVSSKDLVFIGTVLCEMAMRTSFSEAEE